MMAISKVADETYFITGNCFRQAWQLLPGMIAAIINDDNADDSQYVILVNQMIKSLRNDDVC
ncbi:hypothetical protein CUN67_23025 (plasmid) [Pantoea cypripedii]|uniref:Uncharacterized protein n=1 Tax=Pantoea cypripedii TaxID=55209 RepID=A0A6B9G4B6_PANCY|nr:hypothetical protein CUN67_23025 [Pantoea cypripedii]